MVLEARSYQGWYLKGDSPTAKAVGSLSPTYPERDTPDSNIKLQ